MENQEQKQKPKNSDEQLLISAVMRSCYYEVWEKWRNTEDDEKFEKWLYNKAIAT